MNIFIASLLGLCIAGHAAANEFQVDGHVEKEAKKLMSAYEFLVNHPGADPALAVPQSSCKLDVCAINFVTDNENLGFYAQLIAEAGADAEGSPIIAFSVQPNGATFASGIPAIDLPDDGRALSEAKLQIIGDRVQKALGSLGWVGFSGLQSWSSECQAVDESLTCRLNFKTDRESFGVMLKGFINTTNDDLVSVSALRTDPNGV